MRHLQYVTNSSEANKMTPANLAICFGPGLLYPETESMDDAFKIQRVYDAVECLIEEFAEVFVRNLIFFFFSNL